MDSLIEQAMRDKTAMRELLQELEPFVFRVCYQMTNNREDAEDAAQETLLKICKRLGNFRGDSSLKTWAYQIAMNSSRDALRKRKKHAAQELVSNTSSKENSSEELYFREMLSGLSEMDRSIVILRFQNDLSIKEIAVVLNLSESNVKTRFHRLKEQLRLIFLQGGEAL